MQSPYPKAQSCLSWYMIQGKELLPQRGIFWELSAWLRMENMWLTAESLGIGLHIISSLSHEPEVKKILNIPDDLTIAFSCRLGYPVSKRESICVYAAM